MGQIFCSRGRPLENSKGRPVDFTGRPVNSTGRPLEFSRRRPVKSFIAFLDEIGNSNSFEANLQNSGGRPVESYWTCHRIWRTSNKNFNVRPPDQMIWVNMNSLKNPKSKWFELPEHEDILTRSFSSERQTALHSWASKADESDGALAFDKLAAASFPTTAYVL